MSLSTDGLESRYPRDLRPGELVIETTLGTCNYGMRGTVYISTLEGPTKGSICVRWANGMGTAVTHGTRRLVTKVN